MSRWLSHHTHADGNWHIWPAVSVDASGDSGKAIGPAYCGFVDDGNPRVWNLHRERNSSSWQDALYDSSSYDELARAHGWNLCERCYDLVNSGTAFEREWAQNFRERHGLESGATS